jgi:hypothetical protein
MKTKVKIFTGSNPEYLEKEINDWIEIEGKFINITAISTAMCNEAGGGRGRRMITLLYTDGISGI